MQGDGWPLGLQPLNVRVELVRNRDLNGSVSFNTLLTGSPTSSPSSSSSDLDTESTGSFFHDKSITLGSLIGVSSILELSRRSTTGKAAETIRDKKHYKPKPWLFSICSKLSTDAVTMNNNTPSLQQFLEAERRAANIYKRNQNPITYGSGNISHALPVTDHNGLLVIGNADAPDRSSPCTSSDYERRSNEGLFQHSTNGYGNPLLLSCLCGPLTD